MGVLLKFGIMLEREEFPQGGGGGGGVEFPIELEYWKCITYSYKESSQILIIVSFKTINRSKIRAIQFK